MNKSLLTSVACIALTYWPCVAISQQLSLELNNGGMENGVSTGIPEGWTFSGDESRIELTNEDPNSGKRCFRFENKPPTRFSNLSQEIGAKNYLNERIRLRAAVRTKVTGANNQAQLMLGISKNDGTENSSNFFYNMYDRPITNSDWKNFEIVADVPEDSGKIYFGCFLNGKGIVWIDDVTIEVVDKNVELTVIDGEAADKKLLESKPGVYYLTGSRTVEFASDGHNRATLKYPLPLEYRDQVPIAYEFTSSPPSAIDSITVEQDKLENYIATVQLQRPAEVDKIKLDFKSTVLVGPSVFELPKNGIKVLEVWPEEARPWLAATWCANAEHKRIVEIAKQIRDKTNDVPEIISEALAWRTKIESEAKNAATSCTAVATLVGLGSCTNNANLVAALLRASGVPARILSGFPSWSGPLETHYIVEAWVPEYGWYPIESTKGLAPWPNSGQIIVSIVPIEYESRATAGPRFCAAAGVPYMSLTEYADRYIKSSGTIEGGRHLCPHECTQGALISASKKKWATTLAEASKNWLTNRAEHPGTGLKFGDRGHLQTTENLDSILTALKK